MTSPPAPTNTLIGAGDITTRPYKPFAGAGGDVNRP